MCTTYVIFNIIQDESYAVVPRQIGPTENLTLQSTGHGIFVTAPRVLCKVVASRVVLSQITTSLRLE